MTTPYLPTAQETLQRLPRPLHDTTPAAIAAVLDTYPLMHIWGFVDPDGPPDALQMGRERMQTPEAQAQVAIAVSFIESGQLGRNLPSSYAFKHAVEYWAREIVGHAVYVPQGAAMVAAVICGYRAKRYAYSTNCKFVWPRGEKTTA